MTDEESSTRLLLSLIVCVLRLGVVGTARGGVGEEAAPDRSPPFRDPALSLWKDRAAGDKDDRGRSISRIEEEDDDDDDDAAVAARREQLNCTNNLAADAGVEEEQRRGDIIFRL